MDTVITTDEYRKLLKDETSTDEQIAKRLAYLEAFCRNVIRIELKHYVAHARHARTARRP